MFNITLTQFGKINSPSFNRWKKIISSYYLF
jgi:hypothetical protein